MRHYGNYVDIKDDEDHTTMTMHFIPYNLIVESSSSVMLTTIITIAIVVIVE